MKFGNCSEGFGQLVSSATMMATGERTATANVIGTTYTEELN